MKSFTVVLTEEAWPVGAVGAVTDGCPPLLALDVEDVQRDLDRRRPGQSRLTTQRQEPVFDKLEANLAGALLSLPAAKGFEVGSGFAGTRLSGAAHNDLFFLGGGKSVGSQ